MIAIQYVVFEAHSASESKLDLNAAKRIQVLIPISARIKKATEKLISVAFIFSLLSRIHLALES